MTHLTQKFTLPNGLTLLLHEDHKAPVLSLNLWIHTGSAHETRTEAGISHLIEHMLFKGTKRRAVGEIAKTVEAHGGEINAYTSFDETVYYINMASRYYPVALDILSDAVKNPLIDPKELQKEKEVIVEEISRSEDTPTQVINENMLRKAFSRHPYKNPIIGTRKSVRSMTQERIFSYLHRWYVAKNMTLVVVGDFETKKILPLVKRHFSDLSSRRPPRRRLPQEPPQRRLKSIGQAMPIEGNYLELAYHIPHALHKDVPPLDLLSHIAGGGDSSRLDQIVKKEMELVTSIYAFAYTPKDPCLFIIGAIVSGDRTQKATEAITKVMEGFAHQPPTSGELARAKTNIRSGYFYEKETVEGIARKIGFFHSIAGDHRYEETYYQEMEATTSFEIQRVAKAYFTPKNLTISLCYPKNKKNPLSPSSFKGKKKSCLLIKTSKKETLQYLTLPNKIRLILKQNSLNPLISIRSASLGGLRWENKQNNGINQLMASMLTKGTLHRNALEISEQDESMAGHLSGYAGRHIFGLRTTFLSEKLSDGLNLFCDVLLHPTFPHDELVKDKKNHLTTIKNQEDSLATFTMQEFLKALFPHHPYGLPLLGTAPTIRRMKSGDLQHYYRRWLRPDNLTLAVAGDFDPQVIIKYFSEKLCPLSSPRGPFPKISTVNPPREKLCVTKYRDKFQAHIVYGFLGTTLFHKDRYAFDVMNTILSGQGGRLFLNLRDRQGLAYALSSSSQEGIETGFMGIYMGTDPKKISQALQGIQKEIEAITSEKVTQEEFDRAKNYIIGTYELDLQKNSSMASTLALNECLGLGHLFYRQYPQRIAEVTREDILNVAHRYLKRPPIIALTQPKNDA
ncbi:MAG: hypothetical protein A3F89_01515 [Deltaproteobacteria bacterium RIFCSPLOWO2_12_FULL_50_11]|nr:MAG: hypothetical protein A3F89_01515 [Deltaproteobacteria bacterium RIFCSPLOWO2_12_FULL_50_11]